MKRLLMVVVVLVLAGCSGVQFNAQYKTLVEKTAATSAEVAKRAEAGTLSDAEKIQALQIQAKTWQLLIDASNGVDSTQQ